MPSALVLPRCRLMLILPPATPARDAGLWIRAGDVAAVIAPVPAGDAADAEAALRALAEPIQNAGVAFLVRDRVDAATAIRADGTHVTGLDALRLALPKVKPDGIVGVGVSSRHDAMEAGEAGADYVLFGATDGSDCAAPALALVEWWAALFEVPCVGIATTLAEAEALARAGAEFVALARLPAGEDGAAFIRSVDQHLATLERNP